MLSRGRSRAVVWTSQLGLNLVINVCIAELKSRVQSYEGRMTVVFNRMKIVFSRMRLCSVAISRVGERGKNSYDFHTF